MTQPQNDPVENHRLHMKRLYAVQRRGRQQRLKFAIRDFETRGGLYLSEEEMLAVARRELAKVETAMRRAGQEP